MSIKNPSRRLVIFGGLAAGGGLAVGWALSPFSTLDRAHRLAGRPGASMLGAWVRIGADNTVTVIVPHAEMGQGVHTSLPMMLAEELDADWSLVRVEQAPADMAFATTAMGQGYLLGNLDIPRLATGVLDFGLLKLGQYMNFQMTGGSMSVRFTGVLGMRRAGAAARAMLIQAAATGWAVPATEITAKSSRLQHSASGRSATFGEMAERAAVLSVPLKAPLKRKADYTIVGRPLARLDIPAKVDGSAIYSADVRLPGMLYGAIASSPTFGGLLKSVDGASVGNARGVERVVTLPDAVVVLADNTWRARSALDALKPVWNDGAKAGTSSATIFAAMDAALLRGEFKKDHAIGDAPGALASARRTIEATYRLPYLSHAQMEPVNCIAWFKGTKLEIWGGFQHPLLARAHAAKSAGLPIDNVTIHHTVMGGGFGRRGSTLDFLAKTVAVAKQVDVPVQLSWSREEDMTQGFYRNAAVAKLRAGLDAQGRVAAWVSSFTDRHEPSDATTLHYTIPHQLARHVATNNPIPWGPWRSVDHTLHGFFIESFMDELAHAAGQDPFEFRRAHLGAAPRHRAVLERAAAMSGWAVPSPPGRARGIAIRESFGTIVAQVAEVSVSPRGRVRVHKLFSACDPGEVVNPATFSAQIRGGAIFGLSATLYGEITIANGRVVEQNFPDYEMVRMAEAPTQEVSIIESGAPMGGAGEPGTPPVAAAVANAVFALTGHRIRELPLRKLDLRKPPGAAQS